MTHTTDTFLLISEATAIATASATPRACSLAMTLQADSSVALAGVCAR